MSGYQSYGFATRAVAMTFAGWNAAQRAQALNYVSAWACPHGHRTGCLHCSVMKGDDVNRGMWVAHTCHDDMLRDDSFLKSNPRILEDEIEEEPFVDQYARKYTMQERLGIRVATHGRCRDGDCFATMTFLQRAVYMQRRPMALACPHGKEGCSDCGVYKDFGYETPSGDGAWRGLAHPSADLQGERWWKSLDDSMEDRSSIAADTRVHGPECECEDPGSYCGEARRGAAKINQVFGKMDGLTGPTHTTSRIDEVIEDWTREFGASDHYSRDKAFAEVKRRMLDHGKVCAALRAFITGAVTPGDREGRFANHYGKRTTYEERVQREKTLVEAAKYMARRSDFILDNVIASLLSRRC